MMYSSDTVTANEVWAFVIKTISENADIYLLCCVASLSVLEICVFGGFFCLFIPTFNKTLLANWFTT